MIPAAEKQGPDAIVIGAMRAGTTAIYDLMKEIGIVAVPDMKETDYFMTDDRMERGIDWYRRQFGNEDRMWMDFCPNYTKCHIFPGVAERIHTTVPQTKLIYIVRDPVKRAISQYNHTITYRDDLPPPSSLIDSEAGEHILKTSDYTLQLEPYLEHWSLDQIHIIEFESFLANQEIELERLALFLGLGAKAFSGYEMAKSNSSSDLAKMPGWWLALRRSDIGHKIKGVVPSSVIDPLKPLLKSSKAPETPSFDDAAKSALRDALSPAAQRFRQFSGLACESWSV